MNGWRGRTVRFTHTHIPCLLIHSQAHEHAHGEKQGWVMSAGAHACGQKLRGDSITASTALSHTTALLRQSPREKLQVTNRTAQKILSFYTLLLHMQVTLNKTNSESFESHQTNTLSNTLDWVDCASGVVWILAHLLLFCPIIVSESQWAFFMVLFYFIPVNTPPYGLASPDGKLSGDHIWN